MNVRNIDGVILKKRIQKPRGVRIAVHVVTETKVVASVARKGSIKSVATPIKKARTRVLKGLSTYVLVAVIIVSFASGLWAMWQTRVSLAEDKEIQPLAEQVTPPGKISLHIESDAELPTTQPSNGALYTMSLEQIEYYLQEGYKTPEMRAAEVVATRTEKLRTYLASKKSPLADIAETLANLQHWRVVIAISNSESSLGKRCADNNCSGIGVEPGHALWREYDTKADWAKDLDKLIERRYKNWSLEQMNGVYNNPGSENWVFAAKQILDDLKDVE